MLAAAGTLPTTASAAPVSGDAFTRAVMPTTSAVEAPPGRYTEIPVFQLPAFHGGVLGRRSVQSQIVNVLEGGLPSGQRREYSLFQRLGVAWQAPPLAVSVNPTWRDVRQPDPAFSGRICQSG